MRVVPRSVACIQRSPRQFARLLRTVSFHLGRSGATVTAAASSSRAKPEQHSSVSIAQSQTGSEEWRKNLTGIDEEWLHGPRPALWWTGRKPTSVVHTLPQPNLERISRAATQAYFDNAWTTTEVLFSSLQGEEAFFRPPQHNLRHPMIFYYGHPACLYVNKLRLAGLIQVRTAAAVFTSRALFVLRALFLYLAKSDRYCLFLRIPSILKSKPSWRWGWTR